MYLAQTITHNKQLTVAAVRGFPSIIYTENVMSDMETGVVAQK